MPTVYRAGPYRFFFYSGDAAEPPHVHVERDDCVAKFWLDPVRVHTGGRYPLVELSRIHRLIAEHREELLIRWEEYFHG